MKQLISILALFISVQLSAQKVSADLDSSVNILVESGIKRFVDLKGDSTAVMADEYFKQYNSKLKLSGFKYSLITHYPAGKMLYFTGVFYQTNNRKKALQYYDFLKARIEKVVLKCCTMKMEPGTDLENEKSTYYKPFARPKEYNNLHLKVTLESATMKNGKLQYNVIFYIYPNPK
jgi:hypothetical protein